MKSRKKWGIYVGLLILIISLCVNWLNARMLNNLSVNAQGNLMRGWGCIRQADESLKSGNKQNAVVLLNQGVGYLQASDGELREYGIHGVTGLAMYINESMSSSLGYSSSNTKKSDSEKEHEQKVIEEFINDFKPFASTSFGKIGLHALQNAVNSVYNTMTPQERGEYQGWGSV